MEILKGKETKGNAVQTLYCTFIVFCFFLCVFVCVCQDTRRKHIDVKRVHAISSSYKLQGINLWSCHTANMIVEETEGNRSTELLFP